MDCVFVNGELVPRDEARVSVFDAGLQHGVGLFETMLAGMGSGEAWVHELEAHVDRLVASARELGLSEALRAPALREAVLLAAGKCGAARMRVRLTVTGGDLNLLRAARGGGAKADPTVVIEAIESQAYPESIIERGASVNIAHAKANPLNPMEGHKTLDYWWRLRELQHSAGLSCDEAIVLQVTNHVCGGCVSNVFVYKDGVLRTPIAHGEEVAGNELPSPVRPGVTRALVMKIAESQGVTIERRMLTIDDLLDAEEVFLTNSSWGVLPVVRVEKREIGGGSPGEVARGIRAEWVRSVERVG